MSHAVAFFERQFQGQITAGEFALNPFEEEVLPFLAGDLLDLGCGLGNLALAAARNGCRVTAVDGSPAAVARLQAAAVAEKLAVTARVADLGNTVPKGEFDSVACIGLLMFFPRPRSTELLQLLQQQTRPGGVAAVNVLIEGTTFLDMFGEDHYTLFGRTELEQAFSGWQILLSRHDGFEAPRGTRKEFATLVARRPA